MGSGSLSESLQKKFLAFKKPNLTMMPKISNMLTATAITSTETTKLKVAPATKDLAQATQAVRTKASDDYPSLSHSF